MNMIQSGQKTMKDLRELSCYSFARNQRNRHRSAKDKTKLPEIEKKQEFDQITDFRILPKNTTNEGI